jgi:O-methyltransferase domain/Dimerisation domain
MSRQTNPQATGQVASSQQLQEMILGFQTSHLLYVAAKLGIADVLKDGPKSCEDLAHAVRAHPRALYRVLRRLASLEIFVEHEDERFALTPLATYLQTDVPGSVRGTAILYGEEWIWRPYGALLYTVQTGEPAFPHVWGTGIYDYVAQHPEASEIFNRGMTTATRTSIATLLAAYDFSGLGTIVDVGGGHGELLTALLKAHPSMRGILFDLAARH